MLKACTYCGRIHDTRKECPEKQIVINSRSEYSRNSQATKTRSLSRWQKTREYIKQRDHGVCQLCLKNYTATIRPYEGEELSVHHIIKLEDNPNMAFDEDNLITLCRKHHELADAGEVDPVFLRNIAKENSERWHRF